MITLLCMLYSCDKSVFHLKQANQQAGKMVAGEPGMKQNYKNL